VTADDAVVVDARGLRCPLPVIRLAAAARDLPAGTLLTVLSTDPAARHDVPAWARMRGHEMVEDTEVEDTEVKDTEVEDTDVRSLTVRLGGGA
jgi:tRNA 2-thiouridine synthesizing protein A